MHFTYIKIPAQIDEKYEPHPLNDDNNWLSLGAKTWKIRLKRAETSSLRSSSSQIRIHISRDEDWRVSERFSVSHGYAGQHHEMGVRSCIGSGEKTSKWTTIKVTMLTYDYSKSKTVILPWSWDFWFAPYTVKKMVRRRQTTCIDREECSRFCCKMAYLVVT